MKTWSRMSSFVWPYRRKLMLSLVFGVMAAALWSFELLLTFPITVMFTEHRTLANYVHHEADLTNTAIDARNARLDELEQRLKMLPENGERSRLSERIAVFE